MTRRILLLLALPIVALSLSCATTKDLEAVQARVATLEREKSDLQAEQKRDLERMERLHRDMQEATEALRKGGANLGADLDALKSDVARLKGTDEELSYALSKVVDDVERIKKALDEKLGIALVVLPKGLPEDAASLYKAGRAAFDKGDMAQARGILRKFLDTFPDDPRAADAQFVVGETWFKDGKWGQAIRELQRVHDRYKDAKDAPVEKALLRIAEALLKQDDCRKAAGVLKYLTEYNRKAPEAEKAKGMLKDLKKKCKGL